MSNLLWFLIALFLGPTLGVLGAIALWYWRTNGKGYDR